MDWSSGQTLTIVENVDTVPPLKDAYDKVNK